MASATGSPAPSSTGASRSDGLRRAAEELAAYDEVVERYADAPEPTLRDEAAAALVKKGVAL